MAELVAHAGFEWGTVAGLTTGNSGSRVFDASAGTFSIDTAAARSGRYGLRVALSNSWAAWTTATIGTGRSVVVGSLYFRFPTLLPGTDVVFLALDSAAGTNVAYLKFSAANARIYAGAGGVEQVSSVTVEANSWYRLDFRWDVSVNPHVFDWQLDGVAQTQATGALTASTVNRIRFGCPNAGSGVNSVDFDDILMSTTPVDFPLGDHKVELLAVDSPVVREFDGVDDAIILSAAGAVRNLDTNGLTVLALWKPLAVEAGCLIRSYDSTTDTTAWAMNPYLDGNVYFTAGSVRSIPYSASDGWTITGFGRAAGVSDPDGVGHKYRFDTNTWDHPVVGELHHTTTIVPSELRIGWWGAGEFGAMRLAMLGVWDSKLDNATVETLAAGVDAWEAAAPTHLWKFDQASTTEPLTDVMGSGADQTSITGTSVVRGDPPAGFESGSEPVTLSGSTANFKTFTANGTLAVWDPTAAREAVDDAAPAIGVGADGIAQVATAAGDYVQLPMSSYTLQTGESVMGVRMLACGWAANATAATIGIRSWNGATESVLAPTADPNFDASTTTPAWLCKQLPAADVHSQVELDALAFRVGFSDNAAVPVGIHALFAEVAVAQGEEGTPGFGNPAPVTATVAVPPPNTSASIGAVTAPAAVTAATAILPPLIVVNAVASPATVAAIAAVPGPVGGGGWAATPATVGAVSAVPGPFVSVPATPSPTPVAALADLPAPRGWTSGSAEVTPSVVAALMAVATPGPAAGSAAAPGLVPASSAFPASTPAAGFVASPDAVNAHVGVGAPAATSRPTQHHAAPHTITARRAAATVRRTA